MQTLVTMTVNEAEQQLKDYIEDHHPFADTEIDVVSSNVTVKIVPNNPHQTIQNNSELAKQNRLIVMRIVLRALNDPNHAANLEYVKQHVDKELCLA